MWDGSTVKQILDICCNVKYSFSIWIMKSFDVSSSCTRGSGCRQHRAHSVIKVDTGNCIRKCLNRQGLSRLELSLYGSETMVLTG